MDIYDGTTAYEVLKTIGICGEFYFKSLYLIPGNHAWILDVVRQLEGGRYIGRSGKGRLKKLRLLQRGIDLLTALDEPIVNQYKLVFDTENPTGDKKHIWRNLRLSDTLQVMRLAGVKVACYEKPALFQLSRAQPGSKGNSKYFENAEFYSSGPSSPPMFYTSRELKGADVEERYKTGYTRMIGALVTADDVYGVYNLNFSLLKYFPGSEIKIRELLDECARVNGWQMSGRKTSTALSSKSIILARDRAAIMELLKPENEAKASKMFLDSSFKTASYVPISGDGIRLLRLLEQPNFHDRICEKVLPDSVNAKNVHLSMDVDGWDSEENEYYFVFLNSDLKRLQNLKTGLGEKICIVACFPWQVDLVKEYIPEAFLKIYEMESIEKMLS